MGSFMEEAAARKKQKAAREAADASRRQKSREAFDSSGAMNNVNKKAPTKAKAPATPGSNRGQNKSELMDELGIARRREAQTTDSNN